MTNYALTYEAGTLTVGQRAITVSADSVISVYGQAVDFRGELTLDFH